MLKGCLRYPVVLSAAREWTRACATAAQAGAEQPRRAASFDEKEVRKFEELSAEWWNPLGPFKPLHGLNVARVQFIRDAVLAHFRTSDSPDESRSDTWETASSSSASEGVSGRAMRSGVIANQREEHFLEAAEREAVKRRRAQYPLAGLRVVDVGCGGGILSESLARLGADVTGVDATEANIAVARDHAALDPLVQERVRYLAEPAEELVARGEKFDVVVSSEVIEHVRQPDKFCDTLAALAQEGGCVIVTTLNRTPASYLLAIVAAERVLRLVPAGTHDWRKFLTPEELQVMFKPSGFTMHKVAGMRMDLRGSWSLTTWTDVNYAAFFTNVTR